MYSGDIWKDYSERGERTAKTFPVLNRVCQHALSSMWLMKNRLMTALLQLGEELPPQQQFISIYFMRNITYLQSAYLLSYGGYCAPSRDLERTLYETILRGYLFIANEDEANLMYECIEGTASPERKEMLRKRKFWPFEFMIKQLYLEDSRKLHRQLFQELSYSSHPSIKSVVPDLEYREDQVRDGLKMILSLIYGTIQMMTECFFHLLDSEFKDIIKASLTEIADLLGEIPLFEPNKPDMVSKIRFKKGNFLTILND